MNARDLGSFEIDRRAQLELVARVPRDRVVVAESGVHTRAQGAAAELAGADAVLVGTALMRAPDPGAKLAELISRPLVKVCGLTRDEDVAVAVDAGADLVGFILARETPRRAPRVLDVPDTVLSVAVFVEERRRDAPPTSSSCTRARTGTAAGTPCCCATGSRSHASSTCRGRRRIPDHLESCARRSTVA